MVRIQAGSLTFKIMNIDPKDDDNENEEINSSEEQMRDDHVDEEMKQRFPNSSRESRNAGRFLGVDFPYVPGDPGF